MDERIKKLMMLLLWQTMVATGIFILICILKWTVPDVFSKCSALWTKSTDLKKTGTILIELLKEVVPF